MDICLRAISYPVIRTTYTVEWDETTARWVQVAHRDVIADPVNPDVIHVRADLTDDSARWIRDVLTRRYPGAVLWQPEWGVAPDKGWKAEEHLLAGKVYVLEGCNERMPLTDPGVYVVRAVVSTRGTIWSAPVQRTAQITMPVAFLGVNLVE